MILLRFCLFFYFLLANSFIGNAAPVEIVFWHSMAGGVGDVVNKIAADFNKSQDKYMVKPIYKGDYIETLTSFAAAFNAKEPPNLVQVFEVGKNTMLHPKGIIKPLSEILSNSSDIAFYQTVQDYYSVDGNLQAMPFNVSIPVVYYNKDALAKVGIEDNNFPRTWQELETAANKLIGAGFSCAYTSAHPAWILIESFAALHNIPLVDEKTGKALYANKDILAHLNRINKWYKKGYFNYGGRADNSTVLFTSGKCPIYTQSSGAYSSLSQMAEFKVGVAPLPIDNNITTKRYSNVVGGGAIWVVSGQTSVEYQAIASFLAYIASMDIQNYWHNHTGYLAINSTYSKDDSKMPSIIDIAEFDLFTSNHALNRAVPIPQNQLRMINDQALEAIFSGKREPHDALKKAEERANNVILRFKKNTQF